MSSVSPRLHMTTDQRVALDERIDELLEQAEERSRFVPPAGVPSIEAPEYTVQIVVPVFESRRVTHGRSVAHSMDARSEPPTFCGKRWRHEERRYLFFDVVANVDRAEALDRISCVACQAALA